MTDRITDLDDPAWLRLFTDVRSSWFRLETLQRYAVGYEATEYAHFIRTGQLSHEPGEWQQMIAAHVQSGCSVQRVHVIEEPLTDYLRYELACYERNAQAGEDIRLLPTPRGAWPNGVPQGLDFWLFDDSDVWTMAYDVNGGFIAAEHCDPTDDITPYRRWRDAALQQSIPLAAYLTRTA